ncbi:MAG: protein-tyrosine-phosphatase, partial [Paracoccaceae bacterium]
MIELPPAVLFCCDHNAVRSPMAEAILKKLHGDRIFVQSAGLKHDLEIDGFAIAVCREIGVELANHKSRSFEQLQAWGDQIDSYDLIVALSPAAQ